MAQVYLTVDNNSGAISQASPIIPASIPTGSYVSSVSDTAQFATEVQVNALGYKFVNGTIEQLPYITASFDSTQDVLTVTVNAPDASNPITSLNVNLFGQTVAVALTNNVGTLPLAIHQGVTTQQINVNVYGGTAISANLNIGGTNSATPLQLYQDSTNKYHIAPTGTAGRQFLVSYWTTQAINQIYALADFGTITSLNTYVLYNIVLPALTGGPTPLVTLTADEANGLKDIQANIVPNVPTELKDIAPVPASGATQSYDIHYASYSKHTKTLKTCMDNFANDIATIPNLS